MVRLTHYVEKTVAKRHRYYLRTWPTVNIIMIDAVSRVGLRFRLLPEKCGNSGMTGLTPRKNKRACALENIDGYQRQEVTVRMLPKLRGMFFRKERRR